jgi:hypothetical protein
MTKFATPAAAIIAFAEYIKESRGLENMTAEQADEIAAYTIKNWASIIAAYEIGMTNKED